MRKETRCHHIGYSFRLTARVLLYAPSHRQDNTYHGLCYTSRGERWLEWEIAQWVHPMKDRPDDPSHHERMLLPQSYITLLGMRNSSMGPPHEGSIRRPIAPWADALTTELHLAPCSNEMNAVSVLCTNWRAICLVENDQSSLVKRHGESELLNYSPSQVNQV